MVESCKKKIARIKSIHNNIYRIPEHFSLWKLLYKFTIIWQFSSPAFETPNQYHITFVSHCIENNTSLTVGYSQLDQVTVYELRILVPQAFKVILNNHCCYSWNWTQNYGVEYWKRPKQLWHWPCFVNYEKTVTIIGSFR